MTSRFIVDRGLPERSKLMFYFPKQGNGAEHYVIEMPFFENIRIKESKKARYKKYSLISRSSDLYSYLGANSRELNLTFTMTLPHILEDHPDITMDKFVRYSNDVENIESQKRLFSHPQGPEIEPYGMAASLGTDYTKNLARDSASMVLSNAFVSGTLNTESQVYLASRYGLEDQLIGDKFDSILKPFGPAQNKVQSFIQTLQNLDATQKTQGTVDAIAAKNGSVTEENSLKYRIIDLIIYWTNIIRSSVTNNSKNPLFGPPIVRLNHGILYQDIPCICNSYTIDYNEAAGYDLDTLLPRQLKISMKLEEIRTGDFGEYDPVNVIKRDNLAGWESVVTGENHSMDPGARRL